MTASEQPHTRIYTRLDSMIQVAALDYHRHDHEVKQFARHLTEHTDRVAKTGVAGGAVREYGNDGARLDEAISGRTAAFERYRALVYVRDDEMPEEVPSDE